MEYKQGRIGAGLPLPVVVLLVLSILLCTGCAAWQYRLGMDAGRHADAMEQATLLPAVDLESVAVDQDMVHRMATASGYFVSGGSVLLANRSRAGRRGYHLYTPLRIGQSGRVILVSRGWRDGQAALEEGGAAERVQLAGTLHLPPSRPPFFGRSDIVASGRTWQYLEPADVSAWLGEDIEPLVLVPVPEAQGNSIGPRSRMEMHQRYVFQGIGLSIAGLVLLVVAAYPRDRVRVS